MHSADTNHRKGLLITAIGGLALTVDIPLIRLAEGDPWPILMLRTGTTVLAAIVIWAVWRAFTPRAPSLVPGKLGGSPHVEHTHSPGMHRPHASLIALDVVPPSQTT